VVFKHRRRRRFSASSFHRRCRNVNKMTTTTATSSPIQPMTRLSNFTLSNNSNNNQKEFSTACRNKFDSRSTREDFAKNNNKMMILFCVRLIGKFLAPFIFPTKSHRTEEFRISTTLVLSFFS